MNNIVMISGVCGQDGYYLSKIAMDEGYEVVGLTRDVSNITIDAPFPVHPCDITNQQNVRYYIDRYRPSIFFNLAGQSSVANSYDRIEETFNVNTFGVVNCLEAIRQLSPTTKFYMSSSSEVYGPTTYTSLGVDTPTNPSNPYASSKKCAEDIVKYYRENGLFASYARCFNHESPIRPKTFVSRKITSWIGETYQHVGDTIQKLAARDKRPGFYPIEYCYDYAINNGVIEKLELGNIDSRRDWSHASDICMGIWKMMQLNHPENFVFGSGKTHSVRDILNNAFAEIGITDWTPFVVSNSVQATRSNDVNYPSADFSKAEEILGWTPSVSFEDMIREMVKFDIDRCLDVCEA